MHEEFEERAGNKINVLACALIGASKPEDLSSSREGTNMRIAFKTMLFSAIVLCTTAAFAANATKLTVPFNFTAMGQSFPAGSYSLTMGMNNSVVTLASFTDSSKRITWLMMPADPRNELGVVTFDALGLNRTLRTIQVGCHITPNLTMGGKHGKRGISATTSLSGQ